MFAPGGWMDCYILWSAYTALAYLFIRMAAKIPFNILIIQCRMNIATQDKPAMLVNKLFCICH